MINEGPFWVDFGNIWWWVTVFVFVVAYVSLLKFEGDEMKREKIDNDVHDASKNATVGVIVTPLKDSPGTKLDADKLRLDLIDPLFEEYVALALGFGAKKYGDGNWLGGIQWGRIYGALRRHLRSWYLGEEVDPESGNPHLAHAAAMLMMLVRYSTDERFKGFDDRLFSSSLMEGQQKSQPSP